MLSTVCLCKYEAPNGHAFLLCIHSQDREDQYYWVLKEMQKVWPGLPHVYMWDYSR